jgi:hypothetical protein
VPYYLTTATFEIDLDKVNSRAWQAAKRLQTSGHKITNSIVRVRRRGFALRLGSSFTDFAIEGTTVNAPQNLLIDFCSDSGKTDGRGQYIMLTRCGELRRIAVLRPFAIKELQQPPGPDLDDAMKKLYELQSATLKRRRGDIKLMIKEVTAARDELQKAEPPRSKWEQCEHTGLCLCEWDAILQNADDLCTRLPSLLQPSPRPIVCDDCRGVHLKFEYPICEACQSDDPPPCCAPCVNGQRATLCQACVEDRRVNINADDVGMRQSSTPAPISATSTDKGTQYRKQRKDQTALKLKVARQLLSKSATKAGPRSALSKRPSNTAAATMSCAASQRVCTLRHKRPKQGSTITLGYTSPS